MKLEKRKKNVMSNFTNASARRIARQIAPLPRKKRSGVLECLDTDFKVAVLEEIIKLNKDMPLELRDTLPPGRIPNCS